MRGSRLRSQLFGAISVVVLICVALTIGLGLVLTQREVKKSALSDLAHQVELIAANQGVSSVKGLPADPGDSQQVATARDLSLQAARSPTVGAGASRTPSTRSRNDELRRRSLLLRRRLGQSGDGHPPAASAFALVAVRLGTPHRGCGRRPPRRTRRVPARAPHLASYRPRLCRGPEPHAWHAPRAGAGRGCNRDRDARRRLQRARRAAPAGAGGRAELPPLGQPRAEDAAHRDPRLCRGGRGTAPWDPQVAAATVAARGRGGSSASSATCSTSRG